MASKSKLSSGPVPKASRRFSALRLALEMA